MKLYCKFLIVIFFNLVIVDNISAIGFEIDTTFGCVGDGYKVSDTSTPPTSLTITQRQFNFGDGTTINANSTSTSHIYTTSGTYTITMTLTYSDNSTQSYSYPQSIRIYNPPNIDSITFDRPITCPGVPVLISPFYTAGDGVIDSFLMDFGDNTNDNLFDVAKNHSFGQIRDYTITYVINDANSCRDTLEKIIKIIPNHTVDFKILDPSCKDSNVRFENTTRNKDQIMSWTWYFRDTLVPTFQGQNTNENVTYDFNVAGLTKVYLIGENQYGCRALDSLVFQVDTTPILDIMPSVDTSICFGESIQYTIRNSDSIFFRDFLWGEQIKGDSVVLFTPKNSKTYTVFAKSPNCPAAGYDIKIKVVPPISPKVEINPNKILRGNKTSIKLNLNGAIIDSMVWSPAADVICSTCDSTSASPLFTTMFTADIYYSHLGYSCSTKDSALLIIDQACLVDSLNIPTAFTPNGDGLNDIFYVKSFSLKLVKSFNVYNRWGNLVFTETNIAPNDFQFGWNGKEMNTGEELPPGLYIYHIVAECHNDQELTFQGEITVIR